MVRWCLALLMLVLAAALGPAALAHGAHHHGSAAVHPAQPPAAAPRIGDMSAVVVRPASDKHSQPCHGQAMPGASCCCPMACAALLAPLAEVAFARSHQSTRLPDGRAAFRDLRHGPPLPPPRG